MVFIGKGGTNSQNKNNIKFILYVISNYKLKRDSIYHLISI